MRSDAAMMRRALNNQADEAQQQKAKSRVEYPDKHAYQALVEAYVQLNRTQLTPLRWHQSMMIPIRKSAQPGPRGK